MLEIKVTIEAPGLTDAINHLADAMLQKSNTAPEVPAAAMILPTPPVTPAPAVNPSPAVTAATPAVPVTAMNATSTPIGPVNFNTPAAAPIPAVPVSATASAPVANTVPTSAPTYTLDAISRAGTALMDAGKMNQLVGLLQKYGIQALTQLDPSQYGAFATDLRTLGAQI